MARREGSRIRLEHLLENSRVQDDDPLPCVCLMLERESLRLFLPGRDQQLLEGDRLLFAGRSQAHRQMTWTLMDSHSLMSNITGKHLPRGAVWRKLSKHR